MNIKGIFEATRTLVNDHKHNSNSSISDTFFKDGTLLMFLNDAITEFDFGSNLEKVAYEDTLYNLNILSNIDLYNLPGNLSKVDSIELVDPLDTNRVILLQEISFDNLQQNLTVSPFSQYLTSVQVGDPISYSLNYKDGEIKIFPKPKTDWIMKIRGSIYQNTFTLSNLMVELPYNQKYHNAFTYYLAHRVLEIIDGDTQDIKMSQYFYNQFQKFIRIAKLEQMRLDNDSCQIDNGDYNAW